MARDAGSDETPAEPVRTAALVALATLLGLCVRLFRLGHPRLWFDELTTWIYTVEPWHRLFGDLAAVDVHPPTYYLLQKAWNGLGSSPAMMRLLPALLGTACIPLLFAIGRRLLSTRAGLLAAFLLTTAPLPVHQSRELRNYALLDVSVMVALLGLARALPTPEEARAGEAARRGARRRACVLYGVGALAAFYANNTGALLPVLAVPLILGLRWRGLVGRELLREFVATSLAIAAGAAPWFLVLFHHVTATLEHFWISAPTPSWVLAQLLGAYPYPAWLKPLFFVAALGGAWSLRRRSLPLAFVLLFVAGQPLFLWALSFYRPVLVARALGWPTLLELLLPAALLAGWRPRIGAAAALALVALQTFALRDDYPREVEISDVVALEPQLASFDPRGDRLLLGFQSLEDDVRRELPELFDRTQVLSLNYADRPTRIQGVLRSRLIARRDVDAALGGARRVWILHEIEPRFPIPPPDDVAPALASLRSRALKIDEWRSGNLLLQRLELR